MDKNLEKYIIPFTSGTKEGIGTFVDDMFITAAHVIESDKITIKFENKDIILHRKDNLIPECDFKDKNRYDVAVFKVADIKSPFVLAEDLPSIGERLISFSHKHIVISRESEKKSLFENIPDEKYEKKYSIGTFNNLIEGNYFYCDMSVALEEGRSGSPIVINNKIFGILHGGLQDHFCCYLSSKCILNKLYEKS